MCCAAVLTSQNPSDTKSSQQQMQEQSVISTSNVTTLALVPYISLILFFVLSIVISRIQRLRLCPV